jgi:hypothetical protein
VWVTLDQTIQIWNVVGTWFSGLATLAAVGVALYLARKADRVRLKVRCGLRSVIFGNGTPPEEHVGFSVTNLGDRPVTIHTVGWVVGNRNERKYCLHPESGQHTNRYPIELSHGKSASFMVSFQATPNWLFDFINNFVADADVETLVGQVHTSVGKTVSVKPDRELLRRLEKARTS